MRRFKVYWGPWDANAYEAPGHNAIEAMEVVMKKFNVTAVDIHKVEDLGDW